MPAASTTNRYSARWFTTFLRDIDPVIVSREVRFLERQLPRAEFTRVLDLCCGVGRHATPIAEKGYSVFGLDRDLEALHIATRADRSRGGRSNWICGDMRALACRTGCFDAVVCMWQSFGYFDEGANRAVLAECARTLRVGGRLVLDVYHRTFHERNTGNRRIAKDGISVVEVRGMTGNRLRVKLRYAPSIEEDPLGADYDEFEWQLYTPEELIADAASAGLEVSVVCSDFDESHSVTAASPRMQLVFTRIVTHVEENGRHGHGRD